MKIRCYLCEGKIEFEDDVLLSTCNCPHCAKEIDLSLCEIIIPISVSFVPSPPIVETPRRQNSIHKILLIITLYLFLLAGIGRSIYLFGYYLPDLAEKCHSKESDVIKLMDFSEIVGIRKFKLEGYLINVGRQIDGMRHGI